MVESFKKYSIDEIKNFEFSKLTSFLLDIDNNKIQDINVFKAFEDYLTYKVQKWLTFDENAYFTEIKKIFNIKEIQFREISDDDTNNLENIINFKFLLTKCILTRIFLSYYKQNMDVWESLGIFIKHFADNIFDINFENNKDIGYWFLNYSRGLIDSNQNSFNDCYTEYFEIMKSLKINSYKEIDKSNENTVTNDKKLTFFISIFKIFKTFISQHFIQEKIKSFLANYFPQDKGLEDEPINNFLSNLLDELKVKITQEKIGVLGFVCGKEHIIISIAHVLDSNKEISNESFARARIFLQLIHELGHLLIRKFKSSILICTPRTTSTNKNLEDIEAGYSFEYELFSCYSKQIWDSKIFQDFLNSNDYMKENAYKDIVIWINLNLNSLNPRNIIKNLSGIEAECHSKTPKE